MNEKKDFYTTIDTVASNTWPAESSAFIDKWLLRASQGITKRANSVLTISEYPNNSNWLAKIEHFYHALGLPAIFQISSTSPQDLDELLQKNGYAIDTPCLMMTAASQEVAERAQNKMQMKNAPFTTEWAQVADTEWVDAFLTLENLL
ncbi:hypothetical protein SAMN04487897_10595 [Paenibacillus sp. yr247]|uniref:GNAT family N-acetyltransferase, cg3035/Rv0428c family n=1 Tax=Paenibacillus sp. yr247 TaxID=1761880 RepID=UPI00088DF95D|nr:hypothetical protein [Paenibacillus sp. yr247]SDN83730.1 hypothetical protein SAMN04487897_10595 [Paenibacillus sp. yr247]